MPQMAICDDHIEELGKMSALLDEYRLKRNMDLTYTAFQNPVELLASVEKGIAYDIILLDIVMPGLNGIDAAKEIREYDKSVKIIFLTSSAEFAVQSYVVGAYFYQLKPVWKDSFFTLMDRVTSEIRRESGESLITRCKTGITRIPICQLVCCEVAGRTLKYRRQGGSVLESVGTMQDIEQILLQYPCFIKPHRSYLVNMEYIQSISYREIELEQGMKISIPHGKYAEIKETFLEYAFRKGKSL